MISFEIYVWVQRTYMGALFKNTRPLTESSSLYDNNLAKTNPETLA